MFAGVARDHCFVVYERGGRVLSVYVVLFGPANGDAKFIWGASIDQAITDLGGLKRAIEHNSVYEETPYYW